MNHLKAMSNISELKPIELIVPQFYGNQEKEFELSCKYFLFPLTPPKNDWAIQPEVCSQGVVFTIRKANLSFYNLLSQVVFILQKLNCSLHSKGALHVSVSMFLLKVFTWTQECLNSHFHLLNFLHSFWYKLFLRSFPDLASSRKQSLMPEVCSLNLLYNS